MNPSEAKVLLETLKQARRYVDLAYECQFPDEAENERVLRDVDAAIKKLAALTKAPATQIAAPQTIPLQDDAVLVRDGLHWQFTREGEHIRYLNQFESGFVDSAIAATQSSLVAA